MPHHKYIYGIERGGVKVRHPVFFGKPLKNAETRLELLLL